MCIFHHIWNIYFKKIYIHSTASITPVQCMCHVASMKILLELPCVLTTAKCFLFRPRDYQKRQIKPTTASLWAQMSHSPWLLPIGKPLRCSVASTTAMMPRQCVFSLVIFNTVISLIYVALNHKTSMFLVPSCNLLKPCVKSRTKV